MRIGRVALTAVFLVLGACAAPPNTSPSGAPSSGSPTAASNRALIMLVRYEPPTLAVKPLRDAGAGVGSTTHIFNATLDLEDGQGKHHPYLAEALPQLNTDSWRVSPDGTMETRYHLKPNLTWHDGRPLTAQDFAFAWQVYASPTVGAKGLQPLNLIESVDAEDDRTIVIHWLAPYPLASALAADFQAFPRHILEKPFKEDDPEAFLADPFWTTEYVGLGPYRLERWDPGTAIQGVAFAGHALGRPKIERVVVKFIPDENTALTNLLAEEGLYATGRSLRYEHATVLMREWDPPKKGTVLLTPDTTRFTAVQFDTDLVNPQALLDVRVRKALVRAVDLQALNDGIFGGKGAMGGTLVIKYSRYDRFQDQDQAVAAIDQAIAKYPFDLRRAEALLTEAGFHKGSDGIQVNTRGERLSMDVWADAGPQYEKEQAILGATWQQVGVETHTTFVPPARLRDGQYRSSFPALHTTSAGGMESLASRGIPT
jgi:peptide/nickel transport system substrate-binding protein